MFSEITIREKIQEIFHWYETIFLLPNGLPARTADSFSGEIFGSQSLLADFGDYIPFFIYFRENQKMQKFCEKQLLIIEKEVKKETLKRTYWGIGLIHAFEYDDLLFGIYLYYFLTKDTKAKKLGIFILNKIFEPKFINKKLSSFYLPQFHFSLPIINSLLGSFIEIYVLFYQKFGKNKKWLLKAEKLAREFLNNPFFEKYSLFPDHFLSIKFLKSIPGLKTNQVTMMKNNTAIIWGFLELYKLTGEKMIKQGILKWLSGFEKYMSENALAPQTICFKKKKPKIKEANLTVGFAIVDLFCDLHFFLKNKRSLKIAEKIAKAWLCFQDHRTGLIPLAPHGRVTFLDSETDMTIALFKLYELTRKKVYKNKALKILKGIFKYHHQKNGYALGVDIKNGQVIRAKTNIKFNALLIKPLIYLLRKKKIYKDPLLFELLKDR